ncbi:MAG: type II toxin-antitoxin system VapC family toxin [Candidatus Limnocylindrales bacterium]
MRVLLDTHVFLWWASDRGVRVSERVRDLMSDGANDVAFSMASAWEIAIKIGGGRLALPDAIERYLPDRLRHHGFELLPIELEHAFRAGGLPRIHGDPFDRMLVAQAQLAAMPILTADPAIARYDVETIW